MLLSEFDFEKDAVINPDIVHKPVADFPETVISIFSHQLFGRVVEALGGVQIAETHDVDGVWPVYAVQYGGHRFAMYKARLGAPACVGGFEDIIPMGAKRIILLGNCGVLDRGVDDCGIIIPTRAIRDEGTSYHYAPVADYIEVNKKYVELFQTVLEKHGYPYVSGTTWTTDAFYRETRGKIAKRKEMGAICVEMECAAMQAMCDFRGVEFFQFLYAGDSLDHSQWDPRSLSGFAKLDEKERIALLAFELACAIEESK
ncbi:MAG: nucleoside phosphorylase [Oscillospiraceae bacterium]|nr:nucleoside phosphorylase [Oscillospiraceae bacterium]